MTTPTPADIELPAHTCRLSGIEADLLRRYAETFARAAILADRARTAASCAGWVSVKDERKPEPGKVVIFWVHGERHEEDDEGNRVVHDVSGIHTGEWRVSGHGGYFDAHSTPGADIEGITHWMDPVAPATARAERTEAAAAEPAPVVQPVAADLLEKALRRAYSLGQTYWQQADSDSFSQHRKSDETRAKFEALVAETVAAVDAARGVPAPTAGDAGGAA